MRCLLSRMERVAVGICPSFRGVTIVRLFCPKRQFWETVGSRLPDYGTARISGATESEAFLMSPM